MDPNAWLVWALAGWFAGSMLGLALARALIHASNRETHREPQDCQEQAPGHDHADPG